MSDSSTDSEPTPIADDPDIPLDKRLRFWDLQFRDRGLEREYQRSYLDREIRKARIGLVCGFFILLFFALVEPYMLYSPDIINEVRVLFVMPMILICIFATYKLQAYLDLVIMCFAVLATLSQIALLAVVGPDITTTATMAYLQYVLFISALLFQPFRYVLLQVVLLAGIMTYVLRTVAEPGIETSNYEIAVQSVSLIALLFAYLREQSQRQLFATTVQVEMLRDQTERQQVNQIHWLRNLSRYLEHELRNHAFIVRSNLEFLQQEVSDEQQPIVRRALRSAGSLTDLCDSVGEASTLESALQLDSLRAINFSRMVAERILERVRDFDEANPIEVEIDPDLWVHGSELRLQQVFDHLVNNALEYSSEEVFVRIEVKALDGAVCFTVHNRGEPLPAGRDIFAAFESTRPKTSLGMGLYVSLKIVEHHRGEIDAQTQNGQTIVTVTLPQIEAPLSLVEEGRHEHSDEPNALGSTESKPNRSGANVADFNRPMRQTAKGSDSKSQNKPQDKSQGGDPDT